ncbi:MAG: hypothetical protein LBL86_05020, partial [Coriobacteriales bacterium]|nr:hypothetical protein [Coriobacteriales bacterium]
MTRHSPLASPKATIERLAEQGIGTRKSLGQHFLVDDGVLGRILRLAAVEDGEHILEVGPGIGTLTSALLERGATVTAIEKDARLLPALADIASQYPGRLAILHADALDWLAGAGVRAGAGGCQGDVHLGDSGDGTVGDSDSGDGTVLSRPAHACDSGDGTVLSRPAHACD